MVAKYIKSFVFDLDGTLCEPNLNVKDVIFRYGSAEPKQDVIKMVNKLHEDGYYIIISTARRMVTHDGNLAKIIMEIKELTENWLFLHNVKYDELQFGKPYASHYYVDDKAMNLKDFEEWMKKEYT